MQRGLMTLALVAATAVPAHAQPKPGASPQAEAQALDLLKRGIAFRTVQGKGNQTFDYATFLKAQLVAGGFADADVRIERVDDTAYLVARYRGTGTAARGAKPLLISGHMDVVEAIPADWTRDPFTAVVENGYIYGRGATDMKFDLSTVVATLIQLKREGFRPGRDLILVASGDEETTMKTTGLLAKQYHDAELLLNADGGGGALAEDGTPLLYAIQGAEKTYADFELGFTDPGGHSSAPHAGNPIYRLAPVLDRLAAYEFPAQISEITRAWLLAAAENEPKKLADALRRFVADQNDKEALATLRAAPQYVGQTGTTCIATMVTAGHAPNALPQRATATVNCRIFPGVSIESIQKKLVEIAAAPGMTINYIDTGTFASDASPLRPDLIAAVTKAVRARYPKVAIVPNMSAGATDSLHFRALGTPSYGVASVFIKPSDEFSHGLNERTPLANLAPSIAHWKTLFTELSK
jgi:acetylornithine deacetylase/succinyl-diaminopimelate desuccinylase-like protein